MKKYLIYTILFILISIIVFSIFAVKQCSFIWQSDGLKQHYIILKDFNQNIRNFFANPSEGISLFSWNMGLGLDVIGQYSYYVLGDPFAYISLFFPLESLEYTYTFLILLRLFCIGLAFIWYAKYHNNKSTNILLGAIIYTFCSFSLFAGVRHPYFLNAMILFPLLLLAVDKLLRENKKASLAFFVAVSAISNYYFFYMHTITIVIYALIRYICEYRKEGIKHFIKKLGSACYCYITGVLIAGVILLPTIYAFINSARSGEEIVCQYTWDYYKSLFSINLLSTYGENWSYIGVSSIILLMIPVFLTRLRTLKKNNTIEPNIKVYFIYLAIATIMLIVPILGSIMNGFSFPNNRWAFMYAFILSYIITLSFDTKYTRQEIRNMCIGLTVYSVLAIIAVLIIKSDACFIIYLIQIILAFFMLIVICYNNLETRIKSSYKKFNNVIQLIIQNKVTIIIFCIVITSIAVMSYGLYSSYDRNYSNQFIQMEDCEEELATQLGNNKDYSEMIKEIMMKDNSFYRIAKVPHQVQNLSIHYGYASTECFLSIGNKYVYKLNEELADNNYSTTSSIRGMGDRTKITTLLGTKYYVVDENNEKNVPYGYLLKFENEGVKGYENSFTLPIGVCYQSYLLQEEYEKLNPIEKEEAILKTAVIENKEILNELKIEEKNDLEDIENLYYEVEYEMIDDNNICKLTENENLSKIITKAKNEQITLEIPQIQNAEIYIWISEFEFKSNDKHTITAIFKEKSVSKTVDNKITSAYYQAAPNVLLNLGYYEQAEGKIKLKFSTKGTYEFKTIKVIAVPMENYEKTIQELQRNALTDVHVSNNQIKGKVNLDNHSILQITTSYTTGWKAYIDGMQVETFPVNTAFIGVPVESGEHEILLKYEVPYLKEGIACSIIGIISLGVIITLEKKT